MPLIKNGVFVDDPYAKLGDADPLPTDRPFVLSLARFRKERDQVLAGNSARGIQLKSDESPEALGHDLPRLSVVALEFPKFRDGRAFSWARMLRTRLGFAGEIRATGHFLYDQINFMHRTGFDAFEVPDGFRLEEFARALGEITNVYQPSVDGRTTVRALRSALPRS